jgi:hypothetical protein
MRQVLRSALAISLGAAVAGCALFPANVQNPSEEQQRTDDPSLHTYQGVRPIATTQPELTRQFDAYVGVWRKNEHDLAIQLDAGDAFQFASLVWSAYKTATGHLHDAKWGIAAAGGVSLLTDRFQVQNQSHTYSNAADAMACIRTSVQALPPNFWALYDASALTIDQDTLTAYLVSDGRDTQEKAQQAYEAIAGLYPNINGHMSEVEGRLRGSLENTRINVPNSDDILKATQKQVAVQAAAPASAAALTAALVARSSALVGLQQSLSTVNSAQNVALNTQAAAQVADKHFLDTASAITSNLLQQVDVTAVKGDMPLAMLDDGAVAGRGAKLDDKAAAAQVHISQDVLTTLLSTFVTTLRNLPVGGSPQVPTKLSGAVPAQDLQTLVLAQADSARLRQNSYNAQQYLLTARNNLAAQVATAQLRGSDIEAAAAAISAVNPDPAPLTKNAGDAQKLAAISKSTYTNAIALPSAMDTCLTKIAAP